MLKFFKVKMEIRVYYEKIVLQCYMIKDYILHKHYQEFFPFDHFFFYFTEIWKVVTFEKKMIKSWPSCENWWI